MAFAAGGGSHAPLVQYKIRMDTAKAMAILGFSSSKSVDNTDFGEIQHAFLMRIHFLEQSPVDPNNPKQKIRKRDELRKVHEAFQYLTKKFKKLSGRSMMENWQVMGRKGEAVGGILGKLKAAKAGNKKGSPIRRSPSSSSDAGSTTSSSSANSSVLVQGSKATSAKRKRKKFNASSLLGATTDEILKMKLSTESSSAASSSSSKTSLVRTRKRSSVSNTLLVPTTGVRKARSNVDLRTSAGMSQRSPYSSD